jgi:hypothetical protein
MASLIRLKGSLKHSTLKTSCVSKLCLSDIFLGDNSHSIRLIKSYLSFICG